MAEPDEHAVVIHIVYDGPPEAGKTTSVRALAKSFGREVYTPEEEHGRTVFFDWLEHTGGRFEGAPIHCQIASVPGQTRWLERRLYFVERADTVVFVGDTSAGGWAATLERLRDLRGRLDQRDGPPVGVVFQANRRDAADAVPLDVVRRSIATERVAIVESVAIDGSGVREAFVLAVRLALDRVREARGRGLSNVGRSSAESDSILAFLRALESNDTPEEPSRVVAHGHAPKAPAANVPSGLVWPPVAGRILLREATLEGVALANGPDGAWIAELPRGFRAHSYADACFDDLDAGRGALIDWARLHASAQHVLSPKRCIALAETGDGRYRLWQVYYREPSLRDLFVGELESENPASAARLLAIAGRLLSEAQNACAESSLPLPCSLETVGVSEHDQAIYVGLVPHAAREHQLGNGAEAVASELASLLRDRPAHERDHVRRAVQSARPEAFGALSGARIVELLSELLAS